MINRSTFFKALSAIENLDVFTITKKLENLSLDDKSSSSSSGRSNLSTVFNHNMYSSTNSIFERFKRLSNPSEFTRKVMEQTKSPFIDIPKAVTELTSKTGSYVLSLGFRFIPGQSDFLMKDLRMPETLDGIKRVRDSLGLTLSKDSLTKQAKLKLKGLSDIYAKGCIMTNRVLLEAITYNDGYYGRFLILVQIGLGCTVWFGFIAGDGINIPLDISQTSLFAPIESYDKFFNDPESYMPAGYQKMIMKENQANIISALSTAYNEEKPFMDIKIPTTDHSNLILGITLGLAVIVILSVGLSPVVD